MALFQRRRSYRTAKAADAPLGLVVPAKELIIMSESVRLPDGTWTPQEILWDGVAEREKEFRKRGRPNIEFDDTEADEAPDIRSPTRARPV